MLIRAGSAACLGSSFSELSGSCDLFFHGAGRAQLTSAKSRDLPNSPGNCHLVTGTTAALPHARHGGGEHARTHPRRGSFKGIPSSPSLDATGARRETQIAADVNSPPPASQVREGPSAGLGSAHDLLFDGETPKMLVSYCPSADSRRKNIVSRRLKPSLRRSPAVPILDFRWQSSPTTFNCLFVPYSKQNELDRLAGNSFLKQWLVTNLKLSNASLDLWRA